MSDTAHSRLETVKPFLVEWCGQRGRNSFTVSEHCHGRPENPQGLGFTFSWLRRSATWLKRWNGAGKGTAGFDVGGVSLQNAVLFLAKGAVMRCVFLLVLLCCSAEVLADAFKCKENGRTIYSQHPCGDDAVFVDQKISSSADDVLPVPVMPSGGFASLILSLDGGLGYRVDGTVKGVPVRFHVDTGASFTTIPRSVAVKAGIYECRQKMYSTANGTIQGCAATAREITFGNFRVTNVEVSILPFSDTPLLGMNVLRLFRVEQQPGGVMTISR